jgi:hypothetical protein
MPKHQRLDSGYFQLVLAAILFGWFDEAVFQVVLAVRFFIN